METQNDDPSKVKTHQEILQLFHDVKSAEEKVRNPGSFQKKTAETKMFFPGPIPPQITKERENQHPPFIPQGEIPSPTTEEPHSFLERLKNPEKHAEKKIKRFTFFKKEEGDHLDSEQPQTVDHPELETKSLRSTFILQFDTEGNLVGFPQKKPRLEKKTSQETGEAEEEQVKGIKGKLRKITSRFRRKTSEEPKTGGGIGERIKGIFKRKTEE